MRRAVIAVALLLFLFSRPSHAAPRPWTSLSAPAASLIETIERWWSALLRSPETSADNAPVWQKSGVGMDPNGQTPPQPDPGPGQTTTASPSDPGAD